MSHIDQRIWDIVKVNQKGGWKLPLSQVVEAYRVVRRRGSQIFYTIGSQMAVRLSALRASRSLAPERFLILIYVRGWVDLRAILRLEGLGQLKNPTTSSGIKPTTFQKQKPWWQHINIKVDFIKWCKWSVNEKSLRGKTINKRTILKWNLHK
jgi:hypothetical protein